MCGGICREEGCWMRKEGRELSQCGWSQSTRRPVPFLCYVTFSRCHFQDCFPTREPCLPKTSLSIVPPRVCWLQRFVCKYYGNPRSACKSKAACQQIKQGAGSIKALGTPSLTDRVWKASVLCSWASIAPWFLRTFFSFKSLISLS